MTASAQMSLSYTEQENGLDEEWHIRTYMLYTYTSYTYVCIYAYNNNEIEAMTLKGSKEEQMGGRF